MDNAVRLPSDLKLYQENYDLKSDFHTAKIGGYVKVEPVALFQPLRIPVCQIDEKFNLQYAFYWKKCTYFSSEYKDIAAPKSSGLHLGTFFLKELENLDQEKEVVVDKKEYWRTSDDLKEFKKKEKEAARQKKINEGLNSWSMVFDLRFKSSVFVKSHEDSMREKREMKRLAIEAKKRESNAKKIV